MENSKKRKDSPQDADATPAVKKGPLKTLRIEDVSCSIWAREREVQGQARIFYSVTFERSYVDKTGTRRYTGFLAPESLGKIEQLCQQAEMTIKQLQHPAEVD